jgi:hypothetical protein
MYALLALGPCILVGWAGLSWRVGGCAAAVGAAVTSWYYTQRQRARRKQALLWAQDPALLRLLLAELPGYLWDSDMQRCEWLNTVLDRVWVVSGCWSMSHIAVNLTLTLYHRTLTALYLTLI